MFGRKDNREAQFATCKDFQKIFTEEMGSLHLLALMLTADEYKAQHCFVAGLEDSIQGNPVFQQWARSWSKRAIIKNAIKEIAPMAGRPALALNGHGPAARTPVNGKASAVHTVAVLQTGSAEKDAHLAAVLELEAFPRFVFVMTILEHFSDRECATLLGSTMQDIAAAKLQAVEQLAGRALELEAVTNAVAISMSAGESSSSAGAASVAASTAVATLTPVTNMTPTATIPTTAPSKRFGFRLPCGHRLASDVA